MKSRVVIILLATFITFGCPLKNKAFIGSLIRKSGPPASTPVMMMDVLSIAAGSIAGAVGVGFAYPLDSMKTKIQNIAASQKSEYADELVPDLLLVARSVLENEGIWSLYKGVAGVMLGNALIKACAFTTNRWALSEFCSGNPSLEQLCISAAFAGMITSFFSNPIERIKVLMQSKVKNVPASNGSVEKLSELEVISEVLKSDGLHGLAFRGLDATLAREIPGYSLYFVGYFTLIHGPLGGSLGAAGPVVIGALAGMLSWLIVFPLDVCKTNMQNIVSAAPASTLRGEYNADRSHLLQPPPKQLNLLSTAVMLRETHGLGIFVKGITPKMMQAGVNHSVTFYVYDLILRTFSVPL